MSSTELEEMKKEFDDLVQRQMDIVKLFNSLYKIRFKEYYRELKIEEDEKLIIYELLNNKFKYLELIVEEKEGNYEEVIALNSFKALFFIKHGLNMDNLDVKIDYYKLILKMLKYEDLNQEEEEKVDKLIKEMKKSDINKVIALFDIDEYDNIYYRFCLYLIYKYCKSNSIIVNSIITYAKYECSMIYFIPDIDIRKNYKDEELEKMSQKFLINDLKIIYKDINNGTILFIDNLHLKIKKISNEELAKEIKESKIGKNIIKKNKNKNNVNNETNVINEKKENTIETTLEKKNSDSSVDSLINDNNNSETEKEIHKQNKVLEKEIGNQIEKIQHYVSKDSHIFSNKQDINDNSAKNKSNLDTSLNNLSKTVKILIGNQNKLLESQDKKLERLDKRIKAQGEVLKNQKRLNKAQSNKINVLEENIDKQKEKYNTIIRNVKFNLEDLNKKSIKLESELTLIKSRDVIKNIIDIFAKAFNLELNISYDKKILAIKTKIKKMKFKGIKADEIDKFINKIYWNLTSSNKNAHSLDLNIPILDQVFKFIDPNDCFEILRIKLKEGKMNSILLNLSLNREKYFNNKYKLMYEEKKIINEQVIGIEDLIK